MINLFKFFYYSFSIFSYTSSKFYSLFIIKFKNRITFENLNKSDSYSVSYKFENKIADVAFEVSSEGEFEQIRYVLESYLSKGLLVELIYCSDSLEHKITNYKKQYKNLRILRLPLLTVFPFFKKSCLVNWISAKKLILCRYDFFPEILFYGMRKDVEFILLSASLKSYDNNSNFLIKYIFKKIYTSFDYIVSSTIKDKELLKIEFSVEDSKIGVFDFRLISISTRIKNAKATLNAVLDWCQFETKAKTYDNKIILGNFWPSELSILGPKIISKVKGSKCFLTIVPHNIDDQTIDSIVKYLNSIGIDPLVINESNSNSFSMNSNVVILQLKGVLCELYQLFDESYVGGGFDKSVHSLLEPYVSLTPITCGPKVFRSTEYDLSFESHDGGLRKIFHKGEFAVGEFSKYNKEIRIKHLNSLISLKDEILGKI
jgi:3-deoxy-D-manno-octulosonic-acid transferase